MDKFFLRENSKLKVTIVVPVYNHEKYLEERFNSIYMQTYKNFDVIILDDASTDGSLRIAEKWAQNFSKITTVITNNINSGSAFKQWRKGIAHATGDLVWIAEGDDYCDLNFLEKLVPIFYDESVMLAYCDTKFMSEGKQIWSIQEYLAEIDQKKWCSSFKEPANSFVNTAFAIKNAIPNVSSCVFKNANYNILKDKEWGNMTLCGDCLFYLNVIRGGQIAYCTTTRDYYRILPTGLSKNTQEKNKYYSEHEYIAAKIPELYNVDSHVLKKNYTIIKRHYQNNKNDGLESFDNLYRMQQVKNKQQVINVLICCFSFSIGGGERYPIELANYLYLKGVSVTFFDARLAEHLEGIRGTLNRAIPVIALVENKDIYAVAKQFGITHIHTHHANLDRLIANCKFEKFFFHIATMHGMYESLPFCDAKLLLLEYFHKVDKWTCVSERNFRTPLKLGLPIENISHIETCMSPDTETKKLLRKELNIGRYDFVVSLVSRAIKHKGWLEAIKIINRSNRHSNRKIHLLLVGSGIFLDEVIKYKSDTIHFLGFRKDVQRIFEISDIGFLPTTFRGESSPLVLVECILSGKPFVASNLGEIPQMLTTENGEMAGIVFDIANNRIPIKSVANIITALANDATYYGSILQNVSKLRESFLAKNSFQAYIDIYKKLANSRV